MEPCSSQDEEGDQVRDRQRREPGFDTLDLEIIRGTAAHGGLAFELAQVRRDNQTLRVLQERANIAEDLREHVISSLFGLALDMQVTAGKINRPETSEAMQRHIDTANKIIKDVREAVFRLRPTTGTGTSAASDTEPAKDGPS